MPSHLLRLLPAIDPVPPIHLLPAAPSAAQKLKATNLLCGCVLLTTACAKPLSRLRTKLLSRHQRLKGSGVSDR